MIEKEKDSRELTFKNHKKQDNEFTDFKDFKKKVNTEKMVDNFDSSMEVNAALRDGRDNTQRFEEKKFRNNPSFNSDKVPEGIVLYRA